MNERRAFACAWHCRSGDAEYFRDEGRDVLLFIDNIFRFSMSGSEVSALLGRMPSAVGYQPTLAQEMATCRSASQAPRPARSRRSRRLYVPADDYSDPAPVAVFAHLDGTVALDRAIVAQGIYPAVDPLTSTSRILDPLVVGEEHYRTAREVQQVLQRYKDLQDIIAILAVMSFLKRTRPSSPARAASSSPQPADVRGAAVHRARGPLCVDQGHCARLPA